MGSLKNGNPEASLQSSLGRRDNTAFTLNTERDNLRDVLGLQFISQVGVGLEGVF